MSGFLNYTSTIYQYISQQRVACTYLIAKEMMIFDIGEQSNEHIVAVQNEHITKWVNYSLR